MFLTIPGLAFAETDPWGNTYPPQCEDVSGLKVTVIEVDHLPVKLGTASRCGVWLQRSGKSVIYLLKRCVVDGRAVTKAELLHHELCHERMWRLTGSPEWHD